MTLTPEQIAQLCAIHAEVIANRGGDFEVDCDEAFRVAFMEAAPRLLDAAAQLAQLRAILEQLRALEAEAAQAPWKPVSDFDGSDWLVCSVGTADDMRKWDVTTDGVHASELRGGAEQDAKLISAARNAIAEMLRVVTP